MTERIRWLIISTPFWEEAGTVTHNARNQRLATFREPHRPILSRVRCIAWFRNSHHRPYDDIHAAREM